MTNRELLLMLDGDLGERAVRNCMKCYRNTDFYLSQSGKSLISYSLIGAFGWIDSPEGHDFWNTIHDELQSIGL